MTSQIGGFSVIAAGLDRSLLLDSHGALTYIELVTQATEYPPGGRMRKDLTELLNAWSEGDPAASDELMPRIYDELHKMAWRQMRGERPEHTLQPTALIHEAYLQLIDQRVSWKSRNHFFAIAARCMRRILLKSARKRATGKRGGGLPDLPLDSEIVADTARPDDLLDLDVALERLEAVDPRQAQIVELRFFGGYTGAEIAGILAVSQSTVDREWRTALAWLTCELGPERR
jgi:RNA polymerase sigma factor (TIGR02999 family)